MAKIFEPDSGYTEYGAQLLIDLTELLVPFLSARMGEHCSPLELSQLLDSLGPMVAFTILRKIRDHQGEGKDEDLHADDFCVMAKNIYKGKRPNSRTDLPNKI